MSSARLRIAACLVVTPLVLCAGAQAHLGGPFASVEADGSLMRARVASVRMGTYMRHALTRPNGGTVRELTNDEGTVFAVTWSGPGKPDLRALLGSYFETLQAASAGPGRVLHSLRRPPRVSQSDLQIQAEGHLGWFRGVAFIPSLAPPGFSPGDLTQAP